jgi:hypothetical protein
MNRLIFIFICTKICIIYVFTHITPSGVRDVFNIIQLGIKLDREKKELNKMKKKMKKNDFVGNYTYNDSDNHNNET